MYRTYDNTTFLSIIRSKNKETNQTTRRKDRWSLTVCHWLLLETPKEATVSTERQCMRFSLPGVGSWLAQSNRTTKPSPGVAVIEWLFWTNLSSHNIRVVADLGEEKPCHPRRILGRRRPWLLNLQKIKNGCRKRAWFPFPYFAFNSCFFHKIRWKRSKTNRTSLKIKKKESVVSRDVFISLFNGSQISQRGRG